MQTYALEFARCLHDRGYMVSVFTREGNGPPEDPPGVRVHRVLQERRHIDRRILETAGIDAWHVMNAAYAWIAAEVQPVVISVHGNDFLEPYIPVERPNFNRIPLFWRSKTLRPALEHFLGRHLTRRTLPLSLPQAQAILANSRYTAQTLLERIPRCGGKVFPAMVGVSSDFLTPPLAKTPGAVPELVTVCRLDEKRKNVDLVLRALALLSRDFRFRYRVVGDGQRRGELAALAHELGIGAHVEFVGRLPFEQLRASLASADLFILAASIAPGNHEGFGIAYIEANACGTPVLAARLAGAAEAVDEGRSGFFVETVSVEEIESALRLFLSGGINFDPAVCREFASRFTWDKVVDMALPYYQRPARQTDRT